MSPHSGTLRAQEPHSHLDIAGMSDPKDTPRDPTESVGKKQHIAQCAQPGLVGVEARTLVAPLETQAVAVATSQDERVAP